MIVFHGGAQIVERPDLLHSRRAVDFGPGFYTTPLEEQARRWSEKRKRAIGKAAVSRYEFDEGAAAALKTLRFDVYSEEWLDFIVKCRGRRDDSDWDIVVGGVANDRVFDTLETFFDGFATKKQTIGKLQMQTPNLQMCFRTEAALRTLRFLGGDWL
jgi:hypothetical protein